MYLDSHMHMAMNMAKIAFEKDEVPVGAIVVRDGKILGTGFNTVIAKNSVTCHAEIIAINNASRTLGNYRRINCELYVTLEPCHMCAKAMVDARIDFLYFGAMEKKTGAIQSIDKFFDRKDLNHKVGYSGGHMEEDSSDLLKKFFQTKRGKKIF